MSQNQSQTLANLASELQSILQKYQSAPYVSRTLLRHLIEFAQKCQAVNTNLGLGMLDIAKVELDPKAFDTRNKEGYAPSLIVNMGDKEDLQSIFYPSAPRGNHGEAMGAQSLSFEKGKWSHLYSTRLQALVSAHDIRRTDRDQPCTRCTSAQSFKYLTAPGKPDQAACQSVPGFKSTSCLNCLLHGSYPCTTDPEESKKGKKKAGEEEEGKRPRSSRSKAANVAESSLPKTPSRASATAFAPSTPFSQQFAVPIHPTFNPGPSNLTGFEAYAEADRFARTLEKSKEYYPSSLTIDRKFAPIGDWPKPDDFREGQAPIPNGPAALDKRGRWWARGNDIASGIPRFILANSQADTFSKYLQYGPAPRFPGRSESHWVEGLPTFDQAHLDVWGRWWKLERKKDGSVGLVPASSEESISPSSSTWKSPSIASPTLTNRDLLRKQATTSGIQSPPLAIRSRSHSQSELGGPTIQSTLEQSKPSVSPPGSPLRDSRSVSPMVQDPPSPLEGQGERHTSQRLRSNSARDVGHMPSRRSSNASSAGIASPDPSGKRKKSTAPTSWTAVNQPSEQPE